MLSRRQFSLMAVTTAGTMALAGRGHAASEAEDGPAIADNGLYTQPWLFDSFLELPDDLAEASQDDKSFAVLWEQRGCPYCRELHKVNFADERITSYITENFLVLQLDLWGSRKVTDFDGEELEERALARKWGVNFTPTISFFPNDPKEVEGKDGRAAEVFRMPGYFKPFHFHSMLEYVHGRKYGEIGFQRFLQERFAALEAKGLKPDIW